MRLLLARERESACVRIPSKVSFLCAVPRLRNVYVWKHLRSELPNDWTDIARGSDLSWRQHTSRVEDCVARHVLHIQKLVLRVVARGEEEADRLDAGRAGCC